MGIAKGCVGNEQLLLAECPFGKFFRAQFEQQLAGAGRRLLLAVVARRSHRRKGGFENITLGLGIAVDDDITQKRQQLGGTVAARLEFEEFRGGVDQRGGGLSGTENGIGDDILQKRNIRFDTADPEFAQSPVHALQGQFKITAKSGDFDQQRIVKGRDDGTGVTHAAVQPHPMTAGGAVGQNPAIIGRKFIFRVLACNAALHGAAHSRYFGLRRQIDLLAVERAALGGENLRAHQVNSGDDFRNGVFNLDARIDLDEIPQVLVEIIEKFDGACVVVFDRAGQADGGLAEFGPHRVRQSAGRGDFYDLLVAALHGTIALVQMQHVAVTVAQNLHLNMFGAGDVLLQKYGRIAERVGGFALGLIEQIGEIGRFVNHPHAASATAEGGLDDQRKTDFLRNLQRRGSVRDRLLRARQGSHAHLLCQCPGRHLVPHQLNNIRTGADEGDAGRGASTGETGVLRQKTVTRVNKIDVLFLGQRDDSRNIEISTHRAFALANEISFISLETVDAEAVLLRINGDGAHAQFGGRAKNTDGDFVAIGDEEFFGGAGHKAHNAGVL